jgi:hypothetical protein
MSRNEEKYRNYLHYDKRSSIARKNVVCLAQERAPHPCLLLVGISDHTHGANSGIANMRRQDAGTLPELGC